MVRLLNTGRNCGPYLFKKIKMNQPRLKQRRLPAVGRAAPARRAQSQFAALGGAVAGVVLMTISRLAGEHMHPMLSAKSVRAMVYLVTFGSLLACSAYLYLLGTVRPALATSYAFVSPLVAMLLGMWLAGMLPGGFKLIALLAPWAGWCWCSRRRNDDPGLFIAQIKLIAEGSQPLRSISHHQHRGHPGEQRFRPSHQNEIG